jgi:Condensin complex protein MksE
MNIEAPPVVRRLFSRLCKGDNLLLSRNGTAEDAELFQEVEHLESKGEPCKRYFEMLGFHLQRGDNYYYFTLDEEPQANLEAKLDRMVKLVRMLDFFSTHVESFGEGQIFSATTLAARCTGDTRAERFLQEMGKGVTNQERLDNILQGLVRQGYLSEYDATRQQYHVLSAINYLFDFADRIEIREENGQIQEANAKA